MSGIVLPYLTPSQLCINNETYKAFVFSYFWFCVLRLKTGVIFYLLNNKQYQLYILLFIVFFYKKKPTDYCGLSISIIYISIIMVAVSILVYRTVDNSDGNHKKYQY